MIKLSNLYRVLYLVGVLTACINVSAQDTENTNKAELEVDNLLTYFSDKNPGVVVTVIKKGEIIFNKPYGLENIESQEIMRGDELFNLGELSESFTALAILKLAEKNKLSLDNTLKEIFPDFPDYGSKISISNIVNHKSGLANYDADKVNTNEGVYNFLTGQEEVVFSPGTKINYANSDYVILAKIIEEVSNMAYQEYIRKYIFEKLGMGNSFFIDELDNRNVAQSHFKENSEYIVKNKVSHIYGNQGIYMNAVDYAKYDKALYSNKLLKCETLSKIFRIGKLTESENKSDYAFGWTLMAKKGIRYFWRGALQNGYTNLVLHLPDTQTTILILANRNDGYDFLRMSIAIAKMFDKDLKL